MAPRYDNTVSPGNALHYDTPFRALSPIDNGASVSDQNIGEENGQTSRNKNGNLRDIDEKMNEDQLQSRRHKAWPYRLLCYLKYFFTTNYLSKYGHDLEPKSRRFYKLASGMILTAVAVAVYKRIDGRRKWLFFVFVLALGYFWYWYMER